MSEIKELVEDYRELREWWDRVRVERDHYKERCAELEKAVHILQVSIRKLKGSKRHICDTSRVTPRSRTPPLFSTLRSWFMTIKVRLFPYRLPRHLGPEVVCPEFFDPNSGVPLDVQEFYASMVSGAWPPTVSDVLKQRWRRK